jgi:hypothetical protein
MTRGADDILRLLLLQARSPGNEGRPAARRSTVVRLTRTRVGCKADDVLPDPLG